MGMLQLLGQTTAASPQTMSFGLGSTDWIALVSAIISLAALGVTVYFAKRAEGASKSANDIAVGQAETNLRAAIAAASQRLDDCNFEFITFAKHKKREELTSEEQPIYDAHVTRYDKAAEQLLKSYDDVCAKYLDNKIDKERLEKSYRKEIRDLCDKKSGTIHKLLHPRKPSNYKAIWLVYDKWNVGSANRNE
jgi:hypothetical protein